MKAITSRGLKDCKIATTPEEAKTFGAQVTALRDMLGADAMVLDGLLEADALLDGLNDGASAFGRQSSGRYSRSVARRSELTAGTKKMLDDLGAKQVGEVAASIATKSAALQTKCDGIIKATTDRKAAIQAAFSSIPV